MTETELLKQAIEAVRRLPPDQQNAVAQSMLALARELEPAAPPGPIDQDKHRVYFRPVRVPDVVGMDISEARGKINSITPDIVIGGVRLPTKRIGLRIRETEEASSERHGTVIRQKPIGGESVPIGTEIEVWVAKS